MAGVKGKSGPPQNQNAFRHGLSALSRQRSNGALTPEEQDTRDEILDALLGDKGGEQQVSTATKILAQLIAADSALLVSFNGAIDRVLASNQKARENPKALAQLDSYRRPVMSSLATNLAKFGFDKVAKVETLRQIIDEMAENDETTGESSPASPGATANAENDDYQSLDSTPLKIET